MTETQRRIKAYKEALPALRERVIAVALLLAMSASMLTSASFAWISLSTAPEVSGMSTTVAANGNLEIALAQGKVADPIVPPVDSQVGDSSANENQTIAGANITWGNLINLSESNRDGNIYGLDRIALRPAMLNDYNRNRYPLYGASYGEDGRVISIDNNFEYVSWKDTEGTDYFAGGSEVKYGVRAISSVKTEDIEGADKEKKYRTAVSNAYSAARNTYSGMVSNTAPVPLSNGKTVIQALEGLVTVFAQDQVNTIADGSLAPLGQKNKKNSCSAHIYSLYLIMERMETVLAYEGEALVAMANWQANKNDPTRIDPYSDITDLLNASKAELAADGITLNTLESYRAGLNELRIAIYGGTYKGKEIEGIKDRAIANADPSLDTYDSEIYWEDIEAPVSLLVNIGSTKLEGHALSGLSGSVAMEILQKEGKKSVVIMDSLLLDFEERVMPTDFPGENRMQADVTVKVQTFLGSMPIDGVVTTNAKGEPRCGDDQEITFKASNTGTGVAVAEDTYGMAIDLWVRTNRLNSVLTLEGGVVYDEIDATIVVDNQELTLHTMLLNDVPVEVYQKNNKWYYAASHDEVAAADLNEESIEVKKVKVIAGYEGENRVWEDWREMEKTQQLVADATTQGAGSCFVFYANTPTEEAKLLEMLGSFSVAFLDQDSEILGFAQLNTANAHHDQGKVTVPLEMVSGVTYQDEETNEDRYGIMVLDQNQPTWITAVVYLNGTRLQNENVLAAGELQGQLNIQFGSNTGMVAQKDQELQTKYRTITASAVYNGTYTANGFVTSSTNEDAPIGEFPYSADGHNVDVTLTVDGEEPDWIKGFFVRVINSSQGSRCETVDYVKQEDGTWKASHKLTSPGKYILSDLLVDGMQYTLAKGNHPAVQIKGMSIDSYNVSPSGGSTMTALETYPVTVWAKVAAAQGLEPTNVYAQFFNEDNTEQYNISMSYNSENDQWEGSIDFNQSGVYILRYLSVHAGGEIHTLPFPQEHRFDLTLGMTSLVETTLSGSQRTFAFDDAQEKDNQGNPLGYVNVPVTVQILDNGGDPIGSLKDVTLYYGTTATAAVTWNGSVYEGYLTIREMGTYTFNKITIGTGNTKQTITACTSYPTFRAVSSLPPAYHGVTAENQTVQTALGSSVATMKVQLTNAASAIAWATIRNGTETRVILCEQGTPAGTTVLNGKTTQVSEFAFNLPQQDGVWTLEKLECQNVMDRDGNEYFSVEDTNGNPIPPNGSTSLAMNIDMSKAPDIWTDVVATVKNITVTYGGSAFSTTDVTEAFGGSKENPTRAFLQSYTNQELRVAATDYKDRPLDALSEIEWKIRYNGDSSDWGGYTSSACNAKDIPNYEDEKVSEGVYRIAAGKQEFQYAGTYTSTVLVKIGDGYSETKTGPSFTVASVKPTVTVNAVTPTTANMPTKITYKNNYGGWFGTYLGTSYTLSELKTNAVDAANNKVTAYAKATEDDDGEGVGNGDAGFVRPTVTFSVAGVDSSSTVKFTIPKGEANSSIEVSKTGNGNTSAVTLGNTVKAHEKSGLATYTCYSYKGHGSSITIDTITIDRAGKTYTVTLTKPITIVNPSSTTTGS